MWKECRYDCDGQLCVNCWGRECDKGGARTSMSNVAWGSHSGSADNLQSCVLRKFNVITLVVAVTRRPISVTSLVKYVWWARWAAWQRPDYQAPAASSTTMLSCWHPAHIKCEQFFSASLQTVINHEKAISVIWMTWGVAWQSHVQRSLGPGMSAISAAAAPSHITHPLSVFLAEYNNKILKCWFVHLGWMYWGNKSHESGLHALITLPPHHFQ